MMPICKDISPILSAIARMSLESSKIVYEMLLIPSSISSSVAAGEWINRMLFLLLFYVTELTLDATKNNLGHIIHHGFDHLKKGFPRPREWSKSKLRRRTTNSCETHKDKYTDNEYFHC